MGVEHFYLYENESADNFCDVLRENVASGTATIIPFSGKAIQQAAYDHCLKEFGSRSRWMLFCDDDEFFFPTADVSLPEALFPYEKYAGVAVSWMLFGSSGHRHRPKGLVIENYTRRSATPDQHVKCVVAPARVDGSVLIAHMFRPKPGHVIVDEIGNPMDGPFRTRPTADVLRINHYLTKSIDEMLIRRSRIQGNTGKVSTLSIDEWLRLEAGWNQIEDTILHRYIPRVEARIYRKLAN